MRDATAVTAETSRLESRVCDHFNINLLVQHGPYRYCKYKSEDFCVEQVAVGITIDSGGRVFFWANNRKPKQPMPRVFFRIWRLTRLFSPRRVRRCVERATRIAVWTRYLFGAVRAGAQLFRC